MKATIFCGSRNPSGQTARAVDALRAGMEGEGGEVDTVFLPELDIQRCRQCDDQGWGGCRDDGRCIIDDDFEMLRRKVVASEAAVFATPVYYSDIAESLRAFLDRLRRVRQFHEPSRMGIHGKPAVVLTVAGGMGGGAPRAAVLLEKTLQQTGLDVVDVIPARRQNLSMKCETLRIAGAWLVRQHP